MSRSHWVRYGSKEALEIFRKVFSNPNPTFGRFVGIEIFTTFRRGGGERAKLVTMPRLRYLYYRTMFPTTVGK